MAFIHIDHVPQTTKVNLPLNIIIPDPAQMKEIPVRMRKVLYLLHGLSDDASAWQRYSSIETYAARYGLVVVMPSVGRSFYIDQPNGQDYFTYLAEELPQYLSDVFNLSPTRENTAIAGNSMGGYGAFKIAFTYPQRFFAAASFSGFLSLAFLQANPDDPRIPEFAHLLGDLQKLTGSDLDPATWFRKAAGNPSALPRLFLSCGKKDDLYPLNCMVRDGMRQMNIPLEYYEEDAKHDWYFWDKEIQRFLSAIWGA
jgi:S-formylglutathione hydrolase FrmB